MIKDIVNRDIVNLTNCEQEPIHIPGSIQPHGFLLGLKQDSFIIDYCSGNALQYIGTSHDKLLGQAFETVFGAVAASKLKSYISNKKMLSSSLLRLNLGSNDFLCTVHKSANIYIIEAEAVNTDEKDISQIYDQTAQFLNYMSDTHTLKELCELVAKGTREITGYDRVMVYRFDKDYNGEVFAEARREDLEPFLGLHYPHTDIPSQARELYLRNLLRMIVDVDYTPVPIYTVDDAPQKNLDLSLSILRSTSPIHVQYLHNMGVGATLTISLIYKKKLWGLIACHHYSPKNITPEIRLSAQLQGHFITSQIDLRQSNEEYEVARQTGLALEKANEYNLISEGNSFEGLVNNPYILSLCNAAGVAIVFNNKVYSNGVTPDTEKVKSLSSWLATYTNNGFLNTQKLIDIMPDGENLCSKASGVLYHSLHNENDNCIIWFRPETKTEVNWAGDPNKAIEKDKNGLSPRKSFALWQEVTGCMSKPWERPEIITASSYAFSLQKQINLLEVSREEEKYRKLSEILKETNSELENINWISTHDLQEPLRKIQLISSRLLTKEGNLSETVQDSLKRMNSSASRMQTLLLDILQYTRLKHNTDTFEELDLVHIIEEAKADLQESMGEISAEVITGTLPVIYGIPFLIKQLFSNLIANSVKYASPDRLPVINITAENLPQRYNRDEPQLYEVIYVKDNGIGFEPQYAESIFKLFTKLHSVSEYKGSGVGLALCKKIMQNHKGHITATGKPGEGTVMTLYFPVR
jgi:light-regulated signal transduction histidine kinase (bacteriophytochrome)